MGTMPKEAPNGVLETGKGWVHCQLTERHNVLCSDYEDDCRAWVAGVGFCGEVCGCDDTDYEAELLEGPA